MMSLSPNLPPDKQREMLRQMLAIRRFEEGAAANYLAGKIYGVVHCYTGEEAGLPPPRHPGSIWPVSVMTVFFP